MTDVILEPRRRTVGRKCVHETTAFASLESGESFTHLYFRFGSEGMQILVALGGEKPGGGCGYRECASGEVKLFC